jgi:hypothetical protein
LDGKKTEWLKNNKGGSMKMVMIASVLRDKLNDHLMVYPGTIGDLSNEIDISRSCLDKFLKNGPARRMTLVRIQNYLEREGALDDIEPRRAAGSVKKIR